MSAAFAAGGLMTKRTRRIAALGMLVASCAAILATSPGDPTATAAVEGDVAVEPGNPAETVVQFEVAAPDSTIEMNRAQIRFFTGFFAPEFSELVTATQLDPRHGEIRLWDVASKCSCWARLPTVLGLGRPTVSGWQRPGEPIAVMTEPKGNAARPAGTDPRI